MAQPFSQFGQFCLDRRGRRERLSLIASGGVVDKLIRCLIYHPVQEGKFAGRHIFLSWRLRLVPVGQRTLFAVRTILLDVCYKSENTIFTDLK